MKMLRFMLWLTLLLPYEWWRNLIWRAWFEPRIVIAAICPLRLDKVAAMANEELGKALDQQEDTFVANTVQALYGTTMEIHNN